MWKAQELLYKKDKTAEEDMYLSELLRAVFPHLTLILTTQADAIREIAMSVRGEAAMIRKAVETVTKTEYLYQNGIYVYPDPGEPVETSA